MLKSIHILFFVALATSACLATAQVTQTGVLTGIVEDSSGEPLFGARIVVRSPQLAVSRVTTITDDTGRFRIPALPPGVYSVDVDLAGHQSLRTSNLLMRVGVVVELKITMSHEGEGSIDIISGRNPIVDLTSRRVSFKIDKQLLDAVPGRRSFLDLIDLAPGAQRIPDGFSVNGSSPREIIYLIDGISLVDPTEGVESIGAVFDSIEEIEIATAGIGANVLGGSGAVARIFNRVLSDRIGGDASIFFGEAALNGRNDPSAPKPEYRFFLPSLTVGGPLMPDSIWFYTGFNYSVAETAEPASSFVPEKTISYLLCGKSSVSIGRATEFRMGYLLDSRDQLRHFAPNTALWDVRENDHERVTGDKILRSDMISLGIHYSLSETVQLSLIGSWLRRTSDIQPTSNGADTPTVMDQREHILYQGSFLDYQKSVKADRLRLEGGFEYYLDELAGTHKISLGLEMESTKSHKEINIVGSERNEMRSDQLFYIEHLMNADGSPAPVISDITIDRFSIYAQDSWSASPDLVLHFGIRYDGPSAKNNSGSVLEWDDIGPHIGISWDPLGAGKTVFKAGFSRFHHPVRAALVPTDPYLLVRHYDPATLAEIDPEGGLDLANWPSNFTICNRMGFGQDWNEVDSDTTAPRTTEYFFSAEHGLLDGLVLGLNVVSRTTENILEDIEINLWSKYEPGVWFDSHGEKYSYWARKPGLDGTLNPALLWTNDERLNRRYIGTQFIARTKPYRGLRATFQYVVSKTEGNIDNTLADSTSFSSSQDTPSRWINNHGFLSSDRRHDALVVATYQAGYGISLGGKLRYCTGTPHNRLLFNPDLFSRINEIRADPRGSVHRNDSSLILDLRIEKRFIVQEHSLALVADLFNILNCSAVTERFEVDGELFGTPLARVGPRTVHFGIRYSF